MENNVSIANMLLSLINEMGRERKKMDRKLDNLSPLIGEHVLKIMYYGKNHRSRDVKRWIKEINSWVKVLHRFNIQAKNPKKRNFSIKELEHEFSKRELGNPDEVLIELDYLQRDGYPEVEFKKSDMKDIAKMAKAIANSIYNLEYLTEDDYIMFDR